jgi:Fe2+ or Zn2+ uptake regulation protein
MNPAMQAQHDEQLARRLRERGQRVTPQRVILHRALREIGSHATAEQVLAVASSRLPNLSLPTVYATLDLFEELGIARRVSAGGGAVRYDPRVERHPHFACRRCGRVVDLEAPVDDGPALAAARRAGMHPDDAELVVSGLCADCAER